MAENKQAGFTIHTKLRPEEKTTAGKNPKRLKTFESKRPSLSERLMKNTAIACALLLSVMALKSIDTPVTNSITGAIKSVVSMDLSISDSIGNLSFVEKLMPESALVFLNTSEKRVDLPVAGKAAHEFTIKQPWTEYRTEAGATVRSVKEGRVEACVQTDASDWTILVKHADGTKAVYAYLASACVQTGDQVGVKTPLGTTGSGDDARLYFEYRVNDVSSDPSKLTDGSAK